MHEANKLIFALRLIMTMFLFIAFKQNEKQFPGANNLISIEYYVNIQRNKFITLMLRRCNFLKVDSQPSSNGNYIKIKFDCNYDDPHIVGTPKMSAFFKLILVYIICKLSTKNLCLQIFNSNFVCVFFALQFLTNCMKSHRQLQR